MLKKVSELLSKRKNNTRNLWGKEFKIVSKGLDEEEVVSFFNSFTVKQETLEKSSSDSLRSIFKKAVNDAEKIGASMKMKAQEEAEARAESIVTQARQEAEEIKRTAQIAAQREAEEIIAAANRKAEGTEVEAKQKALLALLKASGEIKEEIGEEYKKANSRLSSFLQDMALNEVQRIEIEFKDRKDKREKLWESRGFALKEYEDEFSGISGAAAPPLETSAPVEIETHIAGKGEKRPAQLEERRFAKEIEHLASPQEGSSLEVTEQPSPLEREIIEVKIEQTSQLHERAAVRRPAKGEAEELLAGPSGVEIAGRGKTGPILPEEDSETLYYGEVDVFIAMPVDLKMVNKLNEYLETMPELKILHTRGSLERGTTITVKLEKPMPLIGLVSKIPDIQVMPELTQEDGLMDKINPLLKSRTKGVKRIKITAKEAQTASVG